MKKVLMLSVIGVGLLFSSCSLLSKIGTGSSVKLFSICNKATGVELDSIIVDLLQRNIIKSNIDEYYNMMRNKILSVDSNGNKIHVIDSVQHLREKQYFILDYFGRKHFLCYLSSVNAFYGLDVCNCGMLCSGCDLNISTIIMNGVSDYELTWKEKKQAIKAFEQEILPLIKANVARLKKEEQEQ